MISAKRSLQLTRQLTRHLTRHPLGGIAAIRLFFLWLCLATISVGEDTPPVQQGERTSLAGKWRGYISQANWTMHITISLKEKGKPKDGKTMYTGMALVWTNLPEAIALTGKAGQVPAEYPLACLYSEAMVVVDNGKEILLQSSNLQPLIRNGNPGLDHFRLTQVESGVLVGSLLKSDGTPLGGRVLLTTEARWKTLSLEPPKSGKTTEITCLGGGYHYRVHVPKSYDPTKPVPLVMHQSAGGNAGPYVPALAEEFGWISVGLTESKNGPWDPITENRDAALFDIRQRFAIDWNKVIFGGNSGGAKASARSQVMHPDICAGLFLAIAGYGNAPPKRVPIFFITGDTDFNLDSVMHCYEQSQKLGRATSLIRHKGGHEYGDKENIEKALRWLHEQLPK